MDWIQIIAFLIIFFAIILPSLRKAFGAKKEPSDEEKETQREKYVEIEEKRPLPPKPKPIAKQPPKKRSPFETKFSFKSKLEDRKLVSKLESRKFESKLRKFRGDSLISDALLERFAKEKTIERRRKVPRIQKLLKGPPSKRNLIYFYEILKRR